MTAHKFLAPVALLFFLFSFAPTVEAQPVGIDATLESSEIERIRGRLGCWSEVYSFDGFDGEYTYTSIVRFRSQGGEETVRRVLNSRRVVKRLRKRRRALSSSSQRARIGRAIRGIKSCRRAEQEFVDDGSFALPGAGGGGGSGGGEEGGGEEGGSGGGEEGGSGGGEEGGGNVGSDPCEIIGDSSASDRNPRIINGDKCEIGNSPVVELTITSSGVPIGLCSGTAITKRAVLFAAHCLVNDSGSQFGDGVIAVPGGDDALAVATTDVTPNPFFSGLAVTPFGEGDVAIALFGTDLPVRTASILQTNDLDLGETVIIAGYGAIEQSPGSGASTSNDPSRIFDGLRAGKMTIANIFTSEILTLFDFDGEEAGENSNTCVGDSGGPLLVEREGEWVVAGVTSYGFNAACGPTDTSGFANITDPQNLEFIEGLVPEAVN